MIDSDHTIERAFPHDPHAHEPGMPLRDYFAAKAMLALFASQAHPQALGISAADYDATGIEAYRIADAMLKARQA